MRCPNCAVENPEGARFCDECAQPMPAVCAACGASNRARAKFCSACAKPLAAPLASPAPGAEPDAAIRGERRHLTALFCDLVDSTAIAARLDPEEWRDIAAQYQRAASDAVTRFGGHVAKFLGDGLVVYFGYPQAHEDDAQRAARAGLAILDAIVALNEILARKGQPQLAVRVGIHAGSVVIGAGGGTEAEVFGDTPNIASRVQTAAAPNTVLVTAAVNRLISGIFVVESRGPHELKGIAEPIELFQIFRTAGTRGRMAAASAARSLTPFIGREDEMRMLANRWELAREGEGQVVLVAGEAGIGKSRMVHQFRELVEGTPHSWIECASAPYFSNTPFYSIIDLFQEELDFRPNDAPEARLERLERLLERAGLKLTEAVPLVAQLLNLALPERYAPLLLAPEQQRKRLLSTLAAWIFGAAELQPSVIVFEDLNWTDPSTLELLQILVEQGARAPLLMLFTARPEFRAPWAMRAHHAQITLNRLSNAQTRQMVTVVAAQAMLSKEVINTVVSRTGGIPLFAEELMRTILESTSETASREIPATLHDSLMARLDRLGPAKEIAQVAAVIGREFSYALLCAVSTASEADLQAALLRLADAELIYSRGTPPDATFTFKHALLQDAAYQALLKTRRRELHRLLAETITGRFAPMAKAQPEILARHWTEAGETLQAIAAWQSAGDAAFARRAFIEAEQAFREGLAVLATLPDSAERNSRELRLHRAMLPVLQVTHGYAARETIESRGLARSLAEKSGNLTQLVAQSLSFWAAMINLGDFDTATALVAQMSDLAEREGSDVSLGFALHARLITCCHRGELALADEQFIRGRPTFGLKGFGKFPGTVASTFGHAGWTACLMGRFADARERFDYAAARARESTNPYELAFLQDMNAGLHLYLREEEQAEVLARESIALCEKHGFQYFTATSTIKLGRARAQAHPAESAELIRKGLSSVAALGTQLCAPMYLTWLAEAQAFDNNLAGALESIEQALQASPAEIYYQPETIRVRGAIRARQSQLESAEADFREAIALAQKLGAKLWEIRAAASLAQTLAARGARDEARDLLAASAAGFADGPAVADLKEAQTLLDDLNRGR